MARGSRITRRKVKRSTRRKHMRSRKYRGGAMNDWEEKISQSTGKTYYQDRRTGKTSWELPVNNSPDDWEPRMSKTTGKPYWISKKTGKTSWTLPGKLMIRHSKDCNHPSLSNQDKEYCISHPSAIANVSSGWRNLKYKIRKARARNGTETSDGSKCRLEMKTNNTTGETEEVPVCSEDYSNTSENGDATPFSGGTPKSNENGNGTPRYNNNSQ